MGGQGKPSNVYLGEFEHIVLLSILQLDTDAHGAPIRRLIEEECERRVSFGSLYSTLRRLRAKGYVASTDEPGPTGHSRRVFEVTPLGLSTVEAAQRRLRRMSTGLGLKWDWIGP